MKVANATKSPRYVPYSSYARQDSKRGPREHYCDLRKAYTLDLKVGDTLQIPKNKGELEIMVTDIIQDGRLVFQFSFNGESQEYTLYRNSRFKIGRYTIKSYGKGGGGRAKVRLRLPREVRYERIKGPNWNNHQ